MSKTDIHHVAYGRRPWRNIMQLRHGHNIQKKAGISANEGLLNAALRSEPSSQLDNKELYLEAEWSLVQLCKWLDSRLNHPLKVIKLKAGERQIEVFESFAYTISPKDRYFSVSEIVEGDFPRNNNVEIGRPLLTSNWLKYVLVKLQLDYEHQGNLFVPNGFEEELKTWLSKSAYNLLKKQVAFDKLRKELLPKSFQLPKQVYSIALASRYRPSGPMLDSITFNTVWQNETKFTQVARENQQLLPLMSLLAQNYTGNFLPAEKDPIGLLKSFFLDAGLTEAAWRYVVHHGAKLFGLPWQISGKQNGMNVALNYLRALEYAGLPPPPPPSIVKAWLHSYNWHDGNIVNVDHKFYLPTNNLILGLALKEANARRCEKDLPVYAEEFLEVCWWSESFSKPLDANQLKAGWPWVAKQANNYNREQKLLAEQKSFHWKNTVKEFMYGEYQVVPIESSTDLIHEGLAMRNCLHDMLDKCINGDLQIYSARHRITGKRKGCIGYVIYENECAVVWDVKGFANMPPSKDLLEISNQLTLQINEQMYGT